MTTSRMSDLRLLHPEFGATVAIMAKACIAAYDAGVTETYFSPFETLRSPLRQRKLFEEGRTKAREWQSAHQYGLAVDFVPKRNGVWNWSEAEDWDFLANLASNYKLIGISWDRAHFHSPRWLQIKRYVI